jgi:hypothetical protein
MVLASGRLVERHEATLPRRLAFYFVTTNWGLLLSVPDGVTTVTVPVVAPAGKG